MKNFYLYGIKLLAIVLAVNLSVISYAQETPKSDTTSLFDLSLEALLNADITTVSKKAEKQSDAPGIISVITKDELERFGGTTLKDVLERVPGLISYNIQFTDITTISIRGEQSKATSSHVLVLINGRPVREIQEGGLSTEIFNTFPVNIIERIEVIKGPGSVLYGSDAFSGVINIITQKAGKTGVSVTGITQTGGGYGVTGDVTLKEGDLGIVAAGRYLEKSEIDNIVSNTDLFTGIITIDTIPIPDKGPGAFFGINYKGISLISSYEDWKTITTSASEWKKFFTNLGYNMKVSDSWNMDINATYTHSGFKCFFLQRSSYNMIGEWSNFITVTDKSKLIVGALFNKNNGTTDNLSPNIPKTAVDDRNSGALYAQIDYNLLESLKLIGGMQANKVEGIKMNIVPRIGLIWHPASKYTFKALYSEAFRAPGIEENKILVPGIILGNPDLKPEKVTTIDIGLSYQGDIGTIGVNYFNSKQTDIIKFIGFPMLYSNVSTLKQNGFEFEGKYYVNKSLYLEGSLLYLTSKYDTLEFLTPITNFGTKAGISYVWDKGITLSLFDIYQGKPDKYYAGLLSADKLAYNLLHLHSKFNINKLFSLDFKPELSLVVHVDNLLDEKYYFASQAAPAYPSFKFQGREIYFALNARF